MRQLGYTRVSTSSQDAQLQLDALVAACVQKRDVFADVTSGSKTAVERPGMKRLLEYAEEGDTVAMREPNKSWSELVSEIKAGQNVGWRVFDVSCNVIGTSRPPPEAQFLQRQCKNF